MRIAELTDRLDFISPEDLKTSEIRCRPLFEAAGDGIIIVDAKTRKIIDVNPFMINFLGFTYREITGKELWQIGLYKDEAAGIAAFKALQKNNYIRHENLQLATKTGETREVEVVSNTFSDHGRQLIRCSIVDKTERKKSEGNITDPAAIIDSSDDAIISKNFDGTILCWNKAAEKIFGYPPEEIIGQNISILMPPGRFSEDDEIVKKNKNGEAARSIKTHLLQKDGSTVSVTLSHSNIKNNQAEIIVISKSPPLTAEPKQTDAALQTGDELFHDFMDASPAAVWMKDENFRYVYMNRAWENAFGLKKEEWLGKTDFEMAPAEAAEIIRKNDLVGLQTGEQPVVVEETGKIGDRQYFWNIIRFPFRNSSGQQLLGNIAVDITRQTNIENALRAGDTKFKHLVNASIIGIIIADLNGTILEANDVFLEMVGYGKDDLAAGKVSWDELTSPEFQATARQTQQTGFTVMQPPEKECFRKDGSCFPVLVGSALLEDSKNTVIAFVLDITESKNVGNKIVKLNEMLEQRIIEQTTKLEAANKELEAFSYSVSHDLRAPLRAIDGFSRILLDYHGDQLDEPGKDYLKRMRTASQNMAQLIDDLLNFSRLTRSEMICENVDISNLVLEISRQLQENDPQRKVKFKIEKNIIVYGDKRLIQIALRNLLDNAWKFTSKRVDGEIIFGQNPDGRINEYFVRDNGAGFEMSYADKLFGVFQRLHSLDEFEGTGIGLVTVQRIIHRHAGMIRAEGTVGEGAAFYFTFGL